jgi:hypothetical protein
MVNLRLRCRIAEGLAERNPHTAGRANSGANIANTTER